MLDLIDRRLAATPAHAATAWQWGQERRRQPQAASGLGAQLTSAVLDELDYPILLLNAEGRLLFANRSARALLLAGLPQPLQSEQVLARCSADPAALRRAVQAATMRGLRTLVAPGAAGAVAVVPLLGGEGQAALLIIAKPGLCQELSMHSYAREQGLTDGETQVLRELCSGMPPEAIARKRGVAVSTVRTQIASLRAKTGTRDIGELLRTMASLPPLVNAL